MGVLSYSCGLANVSHSRYLGLLNWKCTLYPQQSATSAITFLSVQWPHSQSSSQMCQHIYLIGNHSEDCGASMHVIVQITQ